MSNTWKSCEDAVGDIIRIDDFGTSNEDELKADLSKGSSCSNENTSYQFIDPRTGEEIDVRSECSAFRFEGMEKFLSVGRAKLIEEYKQNSRDRRLKEQLRTNRPLGFRNDVIESYFVNHEDVEDTEERSATTS